MEYVPRAASNMIIILKTTSVAMNLLHTITCNSDTLKGIKGVPTTVPGSRTLELMIDGYLKCK